MNYTKEELIEKISQWESNAGESFTDYFMHDNVNAQSWAFWLLGKGFNKQALNIIRGLEKGENYFDQEELFEIYPEYEYQDDKDPKWLNESYQKNKKVWAEFLTATESYQKRVSNFFKEQEEEL